MCCLEIIFIVSPDMYVPDISMSRYDVNRYVDFHMLDIISLVKAAKQAIHKLTRRVETTFRNRKIALSTFLDIEGAFDGASFYSMERALSKRGVDPQITM